MSDTIQFLLQFLPEAAALVVAVMVGFGGVPPIVDKIKSGLNLTGTSVRILAFLVSAIFTLAVAAVEGVLTPESFTPENLYTTFILILTLSQTSHLSNLRRLSRGVYQNTT